MSGLEAGLETAPLSTCILLHCGRDTGLSGGALRNGTTAATISEIY